MKSEIIDKINNAAEGKLEEVVRDFTDLKKEGKSLKGKCPHCKDERSLTVTPSINIFKCFKCGEVHGKGALGYLMSAQKMDFIPAMEYLARKYHIDIEEPKPKKKVKPTGKNRERNKTFYARMLASSGLTEDDIRAKIYYNDRDKTYTELSPFSKGTLNEYNRVDNTVDDVIIDYYNLDGLPVTYQKKERGVLKAFTFPVYVFSFLKNILTLKVNHVNTNLQKAQETTCIFHKR